MGKLKCKCGHIIIDQTDNLPYKGYILPDTYVDNISLFLTDCGRIAIQIEQTNQFKFFSPDSAYTKGLLNGKKNKKHTTTPAKQNHNRRLNIKKTSLKMQRSLLGY